MKDIQSQPDHRQIAIDKVGIKNVRYPIIVRDRQNRVQSTIATIAMYVGLPHEERGTHMSRFIELLHMFEREVSLSSFTTVLQEMKNYLKAESAEMEMRFPYFMEKTAPASGAKSLMDYDCKLIGVITSDNKIDFYCEVIVPVMSVCPCSKAISEVGAHNQRGVVRLATRFKRFVWFEDLIERVEAAGSYSLYSLLKRNDEKEVTERGYHNPKFVEDIVRDIARNMEDDPNISWYSVSAENFESIHNHNAYAQVRSDSQK